MRGVPTVAWRGPAWAPALALALALAVVSCSAQSSNGGGAVSTTDSTIGLLFHRLTDEFSLSPPAPFVLHQLHSGSSVRVALEAIPLVPFGSTVQSWTWSVDSGRSGLIPNWLQFVAPWNGSNFFALTFVSDGVPNAASDPQPFSISFRGTVKFTRSFLLTRGQEVSTPPQIETVDQSVTILASLIRSTPISTRFVANRASFEFNEAGNGTARIANTGPALGRVTLEAGETLVLDCAGRGNTDSECQLGAASQRNILHSGSALEVAAGTLRVLSSTFLFGALRVLAGATLVLDAHDLCIVGRSERGQLRASGVSSDGMVFVNSGSVTFQAPFTGEGGVSVGPGATATFHTPNAQSAFHTSPLNNGGDCHANGLVVFQSGVWRFVSPLQGVGQVIVGEAANLQFDGTEDPNPTVVAYDALTGLNQTSRTTHAFVTGAMVSTLLATSAAVPPIALQNFGLLQVMPLARVVAYRLLKSGGAKPSDENGQPISTAVGGGVGGSGQSGGRLSVEPGGELILDTAPNVTSASTSNGAGASAGAVADTAAAVTTTASGDVRGDALPSAASVSRGDGPAVPADTYNELSGDGVWNGGKLVVLSGRLRCVSMYRQSGASALLELSVNTEWHYNYAAPLSESVVGGSGNVSGLISAGVVYVNAGTLRLAGRTRSLAVLVVRSGAALIFDRSAEDEAGVDATPAAPASDTAEVVVEPAADAAAASDATMNTAKDDVAASATDGGASGSGDCVDRGGPAKSGGDAEVWHSLRNFGVVNFGALEFRGGRTRLTGPIVSNGSVTVEHSAILELNATQNQTLIGGAGLLHRGGHIVIRAGEVVFAAPLQVPQSPTTPTDGSAAAAATTTSPAPRAGALAPLLVVWGPATKHPEHSAAPEAARLIFTSPNDTTTAATPTAPAGAPTPTASPSPPASLLHVRHVIGGDGLLNAGSVVVVNASVRFAGPLHQTGQLVAANGSNVTFASAAESVVHRTALAAHNASDPTANVSVACLGAVSVEGGSAVRFTGGSRSAFSGGLQLSGALTLDAASAISVLRIDQSDDRAVLSVSDGAAIQSDAPDCHFARGVVSGAGGSIACKRALFGAAATLAPGRWNASVTPATSAPGNLTFAGDVVLSANTQFAVDVWGRAVAHPTAGYDQVLCAGTASVGGAILTLHSGTVAALFPADRAPATSVESARASGGATRVPRAALFPVLLAQTVSGQFASAVNTAKHVTLRLEYTAQSVSALIAEAEMEQYLQSAAARLRIASALLPFAAALMLGAFVIVAL